MQTHASTSPGLSVDNALQPLIALPAVDRTAQPLPRALSVYLDALQKADRRQQAAATEREEDEADEALAFTDEAATPVDAATLAALDAGPGEALMQLADAGRRTATDAGTRTQEDDDDNGGLLLWGGAGLLGAALIGSALDSGSDPAPLKATFTAAQAATEDGATVQGQLTARGGSGLQYAQLGDEVPGLTINPDGSWHFDPTVDAYQALAEGELRELTVTYRVTDNKGATDTETFTITVTGVGSGGACAMDFSFPEAPNDPTALRLDVADLEQELQASGGSLAYTEEHTSLIVDLGYRSTLASEVGYAGNGVDEDVLYAVNASGSMGDIHVTGDLMASVQLQVNAGGDVGEVAYALGLDSSHASNRLHVDANGDIGPVFMLVSGQEAGGVLSLNASGGNVGDIMARFANPDGGDGWDNWYDGMLVVNASAQASGNTLVGGSVGDLTMAVIGDIGSGAASVTADGGNVGNISFCASGYSASGSVSASAFAQRNGAGEAVGGNIGDIVVHVTGASGEAKVHGDADGVFGSAGAYLGGGNIGNIALSMEGASGSAAAHVDTYSGGSVGNISMTVANVGYSAYASAGVHVRGGGGQIAHIGDLTVDVLGGTRNGFYASLIASSGGNVGNVDAHLLDQGGNAKAQVLVSAFSNAEGGGGEIGEISLLNESWGGDTYVTLMADTRVGNVSLATGGGLSRLDLRIQSDAGAQVGDVHLTIDENNYADGDYNHHAINLDLDSGATIGDLTVDGGSDRSMVKVLANTYSSWDYKSELAADIDMSNFAGRVETDLSRAGNGVSITVGQGGSTVIGTKGADTVHLGDGVDTVDFFYFDDDTVTYYENAYEPEYGLRSVADTVNGFDATHDRLDVLAGDDLVVHDQGLPWEWSQVEFTHQTPGELHSLTSNTSTTLADKDVVKLVDLAGGDDIMTAAGLLTALTTGEYDSVAGVEGDFVFATATSADANSFNLYHVSHDGQVYTEVYLMAEVNFLNGSTFANLAIENFV